jgi:hypothetical protein
MALFGHGAMSDLSPLSGVKRKSDFRAVRAALDPERTSDPSSNFRKCVSLSNKDALELLVL